MKKILYLLLSHSPLPFIVRYLVKIRRPQFLIQLVIKKYFIEKLKVNISEMEFPVSHYQTILDFFTRGLKPGARSLARDARQVVSPVDGRVMNYGQITDGKMIQIKHIKYSLEDLVGKDITEGFKGGDYITLYLSPRDYHRIHHPVGGVVDKVFEYAGRVLPVSLFSLENFREVFSRNRRWVVCYNTSGSSPAHKKSGKKNQSSKSPASSPKLPCLSCWVGALNVGRVQIYFDEEFTSPASRSSREVIDSRERLTRTYSSKRIRRGEPAGCFELGSTVILIFPYHGIRWMPGISNNSFLRVGEPIARIRSKAV